MTIVFLNGTTSAGKSTLAATLQNRLPGVWLRIGIDDGFAMLGQSFHATREGFWFDTGGDGLVRLNIGPAGAIALSAYRCAAAAIAAGGADLIIDDVLLCRTFIDEWLAVLIDVPVMMVGVHCSLAIAEQRERARGDRMIGQARGQFGRVHRDARYDVEVDSGAMSADACAGVVADALARGGFGAFAAMRADAGSACS